MLRDFTKYLLRWRFEYNDGKRDRMGMWSQMSRSLDEMAAFQPKDNLACAYIEAKDRHTREVIAFVDCPGFDYVNFEWIAEVDALATVGQSMSVAMGSTRIIGLRIITRNEKLSAYTDGTIVREDFDGNKKSFHLEQHRV